jgi:phosphoglycerol transferase MdoB-like AlkP superfamily enzyme
MIKSLSFYFKYFLFWMLFFFINRLSFELWHYSKVSKSTFLEVTSTFLYGAHMDASMAGYFCTIPFLIFTAFWFRPKITFPIKFIKYYTNFLICLTALFTLIDINIYREWGTKFNYRALEFFFTATGDAIASSSSSPITASLLGLGLLIIIGIKLYNKLLAHVDIRESVNTYIKIPLTILTLGLLFLAVRGGWSVAPMNPSKVYFSDEQFLNYAALNTNWFLMDNVLSNQKSKGNPYTYFNDSERKEKIDSLFSSKNKDFPTIINLQKPNVIIVIMESFTADVVAELGGEKEITPNFSKLIKEGLLFENIYSASDRTDKGIVGVISGFPSQAIRSIIKENDKQEKLPSIAEELQKTGYHTSFFYGGDTEFSNFKSYLISHHYAKIVDIENFESDEVTSKWGAFDELTFTKQINFLKKAKEPFFSTLLTLSNHEPFELPSKGKFGNNTIENKFKSTSFYTDKSLWEYVQEAKKQSWYKNTLVIVLADHGHRLPKSTNEIYNPARYHIPMLFFGGALKKEYQGQIISKFGSQVDLAATLINQIGQIDTAFHYSKNLLNPNVKGFGFYSWDNGFGYIDEEKSVSYDPIGNKIIYNAPKNLSEKNKNEALNTAKVMMQSVYKDFLNFK